MAKILVTGGAGFIGSHIVDLLLSDNHEIAVLDDLSSGTLDNLPASVEVFELDVRDSKAADVVKGFSPDCIVHAAAQMSVSESMKDPIKDVEINLAGMLNILNAFSADELPYFLFLSTGGALYGEQEAFPAPENHPVRPTSVYGMSKYSAEHYLELWQRVYGLKYGVLRLANVYGPRQNPHGEAGVVAIFLNKLLAGDTATIFGTGEITRDYVYVADIVAAVKKMLDGRVCNTYNIGTGVETSVNELYEKIVEVGGFDRKANYGPRRAGDQDRSVIDAASAKAELDWQPAYSFSSGLKETYQWFSTKS